MLAGWKLGPALAAGNTVLLKPAPQTPLTSLALGLSKVLPEGVLQVLPGGADVGRGILGAVDRASFTGSTHVGQHILRDSADRLLPLTLECGGKNVVVVLPDADLDLTAENITMGAFSNAGQNCCAVSRVLVHRDVHDSLLDAIRDRLQAWTPASKTGGASSSTAAGASMAYGPLIDQTQYDRVMQYRSHRAPDMSAEESVLEEGFFVPPSVYTHVDDADRLATDEIFGPILSVLKPFSDVNDAIRRANVLPYGLAAAVFSRSYPAAVQVANQLRTGYVWVNTYNFMPPYAPFGGRRLSGIGKDLGQAALNEFTFTKTVVTQL
ncbi:Aldehyde/histidinol dehydrogenase [Syncephalastrum racemosum]|uniref:Aldehyde/histidinol dehydrogenase n=1 Tax=Syncephalastrum racemosum TaxID=13706 RepID=A0A1X2H1T6_SYNRA|nr:Aldehyde/histidinol dehydrogenase [Syncephalastrum racemosum]